MKTNKERFTATMMALCALFVLNSSSMRGQVNPPKVDHNLVSSADFQGFKTDILEGHASREALEIWSLITLEQDLFQEWVSLKDSLLLEPTVLQTCSRHVQLLLGKGEALNSALMSIQIGWSKDSLTWNLAKYALIQWQQLNSSHATLSINLKSIPEENGQFFIGEVAAYLGLILLVSLLFYNRKWLKKSHRKSDHVLIQKMEAMINQKNRSNLFAMAASELNLIINEETIGQSMVRRAIWDGLTKRQQLILLLSLKNFHAEEIAVYLTVSKGYIYNQRSELRRLFQLQDHESFQSIQH